MELAELQVMVEVRELGAEVEPLGLRAEAESDCVHIIQVCLVIKLVTPLFKSLSLSSLLRHVRVSPAVSFESYPLFRLY